MSVTVAAVDALFETAAARFGRVDAVVNTAAAVGYGRFEDVPAEIFDRVITTNLLGTANVARAALRQFKVQGGGEHGADRFAAGQDRRAVHESVRHQQMGGARVDQDDPDRGPGNPRRARHADLAGQRQHPRLQPGRELRLA